MCGKMGRSKRWWSGTGAKIEKEDEKRPEGGGHQMGHINQCRKMRGIECAPAIHSANSYTKDNWSKQWEVYLFNRKVKAYRSYEPKTLLQCPIIF